MKQLDDARGKRTAPGNGPAFLTSIVFAATAASIFSMPVNADEKDLNRADGKPIVLKTQGSFTAGGTVLTNPGIFDPIALTPDGQTIHGDHAYVQYQIPVGARKYPDRDVARRRPVHEDVGTTRTAATASRTSFCAAVMRSICSTNPIAAEPDARPSTERWRRCRAQDRPENKAFSSGSAWASGQSISRTRSFRAARLR
jgi:hypothetical protein